MRIALVALLALLLAPSAMAARWMPAYASARLVRDGITWPNGTYWGVDAASCRGHLPFMLLRYGRLRCKILVTTGYTNKGVGPDAKPIQLRATVLVVPLRGNDARIDLLQASA